MAAPNEAKPKYLAVISMYPDMYLTLHPEKFSYIKMDDGTHKEVRIEPDKALQFNKHVAFIEESELDCLRNKFRYGTEFMTSDDLKALDRTPSGRITANGFRNSVLRASHRANNPIGNDTGDVHELVKAAEEKAKLM